MTTFYCSWCAPGRLSLVPGSDPHLPRRAKLWPRPVELAWRGKHSPKCLEDKFCEVRGIRLPHSGGALTNRGDAPYTANPTCTKGVFSEVRSPLRLVTFVVTLGRRSSCRVVL